MCGIAGCINSSLKKEDIDQLKHRGPDYQSIIKTSFGRNIVFFGHTRLSIIDLSTAGNQPMYSTCGKYCIVFNGEIYNHLSLRKKLSGVDFKGGSDTETLLYYLREYGIKGIKDFNGIFSFAFLDKVKEKLYLVKDFFGVKPLYYYLKDNKLIFGSEIKIIKNNRDYKKEIDLDALNSFLTFRYNPSPKTLFKDIHKLEAATYLEYSANGKVRFCNYWSKNQKVDVSITESEAITEYKHLLDQAVERQMLSDVPVGLLLSGGLDSAVLGQLMAKKSSQKINTFTVGFEGKGNFNELDDAHETANFIGSTHHETFMNREEYMNCFYNSFYHTEEPIAEPTIPALYFVSKLASQHVKVVLSGQGADEPMAGYKRYRGEKILSDYRWLFSKIPTGIASIIFPNSASIERGLYSAKFDNELDRFIAIYTLFTPDMKKALLKPDLQNYIAKEQGSLFERNYNLTDPKADSLSRLLFLDTRSMLPDNLLLFNDKMTMANSIENRVPYLDIDLINFLETLPIQFKLNGRLTKYVHRKAAEEWLPGHIINRKKRAFETPVGEWFKDELSKTLIELVESPASLSRVYFNKEGIRKMINLHIKRKKDYKKHLFILLSLELWYKNFYEA